MMGIDANYAFGHRLGIYGWPAWVIIDQDGIVRFQGHERDPRLPEVRRCIEELVARGKATPGKLEGGIAFPAGVLAARAAQRERSPRLVLDASGKPNVVYYSNCDGLNGVYLRRFTQQGEAIASERLSPTNAEAYCAACALDGQGTLWVTWCGWHEKFYDIYVLARHEGQLPVLRRLTESDDDAMSPKIAAGPDGTVTLTYYKWAMLWGSSRDRNIFERTYDPARRTWSAEAEVSPHVPEVEDHTDPDVVIDRNGASWIVWSYDYHPSLYKHPVDAAEPTIFAAHVASGAVSAPVVVGATGPLRHAIDLFPSAALDGQGVLWCAWDCSEPWRCIRLARLGETGNDFKLVSTHGAAGATSSTPELSAAGGNRLLLAWSQRNHPGSWQGKVALLADGQPLKTITLTEDADVLFPQAQQGADGRSWVAYERSTPEGSRIVLRNITRELDLPPAASHSN
jgi:hypothetical protein